jgi:hypothetical protein
VSHRGRKNADESLQGALAVGKTIRQAAALAGVSERTVNRRLQDTAFRRRIEELRAGMVQEALGKMADGMSDAAATLRKLLKAKGESVRLGAARSILELGSKLRESVELESRLQALEAQMIAQEG